MKYCNYLKGEVALLLLLCVTLQVDHLLGQQQHAATTTIPDSPQQLAEWIVRFSCEADNLTNFYLNIRETENMERKYPAWSNCKRKLKIIYV